MRSDIGLSKPVHEPPVNIGLFVTHCHYQRSHQRALLFDKEDTLDGDRGVRVNDEGRVCEVRVEQRQHGQQLLLGKLSGRRCEHSSQRLHLFRQLTWFLNVYKNLMASAWMMGCTAPGPACRSGRICSEKNWITSTSEFVEVTPCWEVDPRDAIDVSKKMAVSLLFQFVDGSEAYCCVEPEIG